MSDQPWSGDACSLVEAFRRGERSPREELEATLAAIERSDLNCFSHLDPERALAAIDAADVSLPFGGVPVGIKELDSVSGWPDTGGSLVFRDRVATETQTSVRWLTERGGAVPVGLTTSSEFGGLNVSFTKLNGATHNPWGRGRTAGGSSGGSGSAVAGGLVSLCTAADGGGSIRIPAAFNGLFGLKGTYGRVPRGPHAYSRPSTEVFGCLARSVRDTARYYDVCAGAHPRDPWSLPSSGGWEAALGSHELRGRKIGFVPALGGVVLADGLEEHLRSAAETLAAATGMELVDLEIETPNLASEWMMSNVSTLLAELDHRWPRCGKDLTHAIDDGLRLSQALYNLRSAAAFERKRLRLNDAMAAAFERVDFIVAATNDGPPFAADAEMSNPPSVVLDQVMKHPVTRAMVSALLSVARMLGGVFPRFPSLLLDQVAERIPELVNMGALTIVSNIYGNPAASIPSAPFGGMPLGMQVLARHHEDALLLDLGLAAEREIGWPMVAPTHSD